MDSQQFDKRQVTIEQMTQQEINVAVDWARQEGWNPGIHDAECFYHADPKGFYAAKMGGEIVGTVSVVKYAGRFGFAGFYIVRPDMRRNGIGAILYKFFEDYGKDFNVGIDGVLQMQSTYERHGLTYSHKNSRYAGTAKATAKLSNHCIPISQKDLAAVAAFDAKFFSTPRPQFLECWLFQKDAHAFIIKENGTGEIVGYGVIRKCFQGHKVGPLFANTPDIAAEILESLMSTVPDEAVFLDVPEPNASAIALAQKSNMQSVFATVRMYTKQVPALPLDKIYGITSFELG